MDRRLFIKLAGVALTAPAAALAATPKGLTFDEALGRVIREKLEVQHGVQFNRYCNCIGYPIWESGLQSGSVIRFNTRPF